MQERIEHPEYGDRKRDQPLIVVTGSSGLLGSNLVKRLASRYRVVGLDREGPDYPPLEAELVLFDLTDEKMIASAMERIRYGYGSKIGSVVHLAAYYSFSKEDSPMYDEVTVKGTERLLRQLQDFEVDQFLFSSTNLVYKPTEPGKKIHEDCPVEANWGYPESKINTEQLISKERGGIPAHFLRIAGAYDDEGHSIPITNQIKRIYEKEFTSHFYSGELEHGDVFVHLDDVLDALEKAVDKRHELPKELAINIGETETPTYKELQDEIGRLIHGKEWETFEMPEPLAKAGAWGMNLMGDAFIKPWMINRAGDHYELDISRAKKHLEWEPKHRVMDTIPKMIEKLKADPEEFYRKNNLE